MISEVLTGELETAPEWVRTLLDNYNDDCLEKVPLTAEARELANQLYCRKCYWKNKFGRLQTYSACYNQQSGCVGKLEF